MTPGTYVVSDEFGNVINVYMEVSEVVAEGTVIHLGHATLGLIGVVNLGYGQQFGRVWEGQ